MEFTQEQQIAITTTQTNLIVTAGAGSGKTRVLVERFMTLLDQNRTWPLAAIVAITFTEKAAREMRDRIRSAIRAKTADTDFWRNHEAALDSARIGTIHALCGQILRANPVEARLDPGFQVLDEVEAGLLYQRAMEQALVRLIETSSGELLLHYDVQAVYRVLADFRSRSKTEAFIEYLADQTPEKLQTTWQKQWIETTTGLVLAIHQDNVFFDCLHWVDTFSHPPMDDKMWINWEKVLEWRAILQEDDPLRMREALLQLKEGISLVGGVAAKWGGKDILQDCKNALRSIREMAETYLAQFFAPPNELDEQMTDLLFWWRDVLQLVQEEYDYLKTEQNALDFDDLELKTVTLLETYPKVAQRYAEGEFQHVMVDEFQDTNALQRRIIYALCGIDMVGGKAPSGRLFVVGDPKQSIYAFRGADVSVFDQVYAEILTTGGQAVALSQSFRSHECLVGMVNEVFAQIMQPTGGAMERFSVAYEPMAAHRPREAHFETPLVVCVLQKPDAGQVVDMNSWEAHYLGEYLKNFVESGKIIWDKEQNSSRPVHYGDITILFQSMNKSPIFERVFQELGLPYITVAGKGYFDRQEVWDVMNLLAALHNPSDNLALASVLRSPMFGLSDDALFALRLRSGKESLTLWQVVMMDETEWASIPDDDLSTARFARKTLHTLHGLAGRVTIAELLEQALELTGFEATLTGLQNGERRRANINKLLTVARQSKRVSLGEFNAYLRDVRDEAREGEAALEAEGAITLMSVHKSKGLEFPVVVLADTAWTRRADENLVILDPVIGVACKIQGNDEKPFAYQLAQKYGRERDLAERKRLFYVAATRAQDYLIVIGKATKNADKSADWLSQLRMALTNDGMIDELIPSAKPSVFSYEWGNLEFHVPIAPDLKRREYQAASTLWEEVTAEVTPETNHLPLLRTVNIEIPGHRWHINATDLEKLHQRADFRRQLVRGMPPPVKPVVREHHAGFVIGNVVHRALKVGLLPSLQSADTLEQGLIAYIWEEGVSSKQQQKEIIREVQGLLHQYEQSNVAKMLRQADAVYREIPFIYEIGRYIIHGIIDTVFRLDGQWVVLDYKTSYVRDTIEAHSQRYHYQMGAYAKAVEEQTGQSPQVWLYYLHHHQPIQLHENDWRQAIASLNTEIESILRAE